MSEAYLSTKVTLQTLIATQVNISLSVHQNVTNRKKKHASNK